MTSTHRGRGVGLKAGIVMDMSWQICTKYGCRREGGNLSATGEWRVEREEKTYQMKINVSNLTVGRLLVSCI